MLSKTNFKVARINQTFFINLEKICKQLAFIYRFLLENIEQGILYSCSTKTFKNQCLIYNQCLINSLSTLWSSLVRIADARKKFATALTSTIQYLSSGTLLCTASYAKSDR